MDHGSGDTRARLRQGLSIWALALAATFVACAAFIAPAAQAERVLDAELSLIGGCSGKVEALDPVEDPGCPTTTPPASGHPPAGIFADPRGVTTDFYGNIYVSSFGKLENGSQGRVDVFDPDGVFITELKTTGPKSLAVDSKGNLYVIAEVESARRLFRFAPTGTYEPGAGKIEYGSVPVALSQPEASSASLHSGIAVNVANDHVFANYGGEGLIEYDSAEAGNVILRRIAMPTYPYGVGIAVDAERGRLYATANGLRIDIFDLNEVVGSPPNEEYKKVGTIEGSAVPAGEFGGFLSVAVDEGTGHVFVLDGESNVVFEFESTGTYLATIEHGFISSPGAVIGVDNGPFSPHGALSTTGRYLYVPSGKTGTGHSFAFEESNSRAPVVKSVSTAGLTENEVEFLAAINPGNLETTYTFEYTTQESFEEEGFGAATIAGSGKLPAGNLDDEASAVAGGLLPETQYRFRVVASNEKEPSAEMQGTFSTYPATPTEPTACENQTLRTGRSALLPDCRAYELVTPADTNARAPLGVGHEGGWFTTHQVSPGGDKVPFRVEGGSLPGIGGTGSYLGDPYLSSRSANGWNTAYIGPTGEEAVTVMPGGNSPDKGYSFFNAEGAGSAAFPGRSTTYLRYPDGHTELLGKGSVGTDPEVLGMLISEGAQHVIFGTGAGASETTAIQLEPDAPPSGTRAIYDRSPDRTLHVISLKPGNIPLAADELAVFTGASLDGEGVAFEVNNKTLYLRYQDSETFEIGEGVTFAGVAEGGNYLFYLEGGRLWRFDAVTEDRTPFSSSPVVPVNVSADGSAAYFISTSKLSSEPNPNGAFAKAGKQNLYLSREGAISFVGTITERDVVGRVGTSERVDGLGLWADAVGKPTPGTLASDPSRTTPNGGVIVFQSRAPLAGYDPEGHAQIYRYDSVGNELQCLSCNPTGGPAIADASFQSEQREGFVLFYNQAWLENLRPDGRRAIFQSMEALVPGDTDGLQDIYEWEDKGVGSCTRSGGCLYLISSGHSLRNDYLYAVSESGNDVFVLSSDLLLPADLDETPSIYDARVGGGFPETGSVECQGEGCRPGLSPAPALPDAQTPVQGPGENFKSRPCGKGKHKVKRHGQTRCVKKKHKKQRRSRAGSDKKGARK